MNHPDALVDIRRGLEQIYDTRDEQDAWLDQPNSLLGGQAPNDVILDGNAEDVLEVIEIILTGSYI